MLLFELARAEIAGRRVQAGFVVKEGLFGEIPSRLRIYLDHDAIARDLAYDDASNG